MLFASGVYDRSPSPTDTPQKTDDVQKSEPKRQQIFFKNQTSTKSKVKVWKRTKPNEIEIDQ